MDTVQWYFRVNREDIAYLKFVLESYEGLGVLRTVDPRSGIVEVMVPPGLEEDMEMVLKGLRDEISMERIATPPQRPL
mgnify:CR=1 FL=1|jgi:hypothetical protein